MSLPVRSSLRRLGIGLVTGAVVAASAVTGATAAQAAVPTTDNAATVYRVSGAALAPEAVVPAGRSLTPARLVVSDPFTNEPSGEFGDGISLAGPAKEVRLTRPRLVVPARPGEAATFTINGVAVATTVPNWSLQSVPTDTGSLRSVVFTAGGATYVLPQNPVGVPTRSVATSTVLAPEAGSVRTYEFGLLPVDAQLRNGTIVVQSGGSPAFTARTLSARVYDADNTRRNADALAEELWLTQVSSLTTSPDWGQNEVLATVTLRNGATVTVRGLQWIYPGTYGISEAYYALDRAALAAAGGSVGAVTRVVSFRATDHELTWQDLGFDLA